MAGPTNIAVNFVNDVGFCFGRVVLKVIDRVLAGPTEVVDARIDDESNGSPHVINELAVTRVGICVESHVVTQSFGVKPPALDECSDTAVTTKLRQTLYFLRKGNLQVVSGDALMHRQDLHFIFGAHFGAVQINVVPTGSTAV